MKREMKRRIVAFFLLLSMVICALCSLGENTVKAGEVTKSNEAKSTTAGNVVVTPVLSHGADTYNGYKYCVTDLNQDGKPEYFFYSADYARIVTGGFFLGEATGEYTRFNPDSCSYIKTFWDEEKHEIWVYFEAQPTGVTETEIVSFNLDNGEVKRENSANASTWFTENQLKMKLQQYTPLDELLNKNDFKRVPYGKYVEFAHEVAAEIQISLTAEEEAILAAKENNFEPAKTGSGMNQINVTEGDGFLFFYASDFEDGEVLNQKLMEEASHITNGENLISVFVYISPMIDHLVLKKETLEAIGNAMGLPQSGSDKGKRLSVNFYHTQVDFYTLDAMYDYDFNLDIFGECTDEVVNNIAEAFYGEEYHYDLLVVNDLLEREGFGLHTGIPLYKEANENTRIALYYYHAETKTFEKVDESQVTWEKVDRPFSFLEMKKAGAYLAAYSKETGEENFPMEISCPHDFGEWEVVTEPSFKKVGINSRECALCKEVENEEIAKLDVNPKEIFLYIKKNILKIFGKQEKA